MTPEEIKDIISTMVAEGMIDPERALLDREYLIERFFMYISAANIARASLNMPLLI